MAKGGPLVTVEWLGLAPSNYGKWLGVNPPTGAMINAQGCGPISVVEMVRGRPLVAVEIKKLGEDP